MAADFTAEVGSTAEAVFILAADFTAVEDSVEALAADEALEAAADSVVAGGSAVVFEEGKVSAHAADLGVRTAAGCIVAVGADLAAGTRRAADIADMGERDMAEEGSMDGLALQAGVSAAMRRGFRMRDRR